MEQAGARLLHSGSILAPFDAFSSHQRLSVVVDKTWIWERSSRLEVIFGCVQADWEAQRELQGHEVVFWVLEDGRRLCRWGLDGRRHLTSPWDLHVEGEIIQYVLMCLSCRGRIYQECLIISAEDLNCSLLLRLLGLIPQSNQTDSGESRHWFECSIFTR